MLIYNYSTQTLPYRCEDQEGRQCPLSLPIWYSEEGLHGYVVFCSKAARSCLVLHHSPQLGACICCDTEFH